MKLETKNTYEVKNIICDAKGNIQKIVYENDKLIIKKAKEVRSEKQKKFLNDMQNKSEFKELLNQECGKFYFYFYNQGLFSLPIKESIKARFLYLCTYACYGDTGLYICHKNNNKRMKKEDVIKLLRLSDREAKSTIKTLLDFNLLRQDREFLLVNKQFAYRGELSKAMEKKDHTRMFNDGIRELYENCSATQHKQLYYLFMLLPYVNKKFNAICANPDEEHAEDVIPLRLSDICERVGYNLKNSGRFKNEMYKLKVFGQYAIKGIEGENGMWFKINPRILYAGTEDHQKELEELLFADFIIN